MIYYLFALNAIVFKVPENIHVFSCEEQNGANRIAEKIGVTLMKVARALCKFIALQIMR